MAGVVLFLAQKADLVGATVFRLLGSLIQATGWKVVIRYP